MQIKNIATFAAFSALLAACGGDVVISPTNVTNNDGQIINEGDNITNEEGCCTTGGGSDDTVDVEVDLGGGSSASSQIVQDDGSAFPAGTTFAVQSAPSNGFVFIDGSGNYTYRPNVGLSLIHI